MEYKLPLPKVTAWQTDHAVHVSDGRTMTPEEFHQEFVPVSGGDENEEPKPSRLTCEMCGASAHRDDAMERRCNGCEYLVRQCICTHQES